MIDTIANHFVSNPEQLLAAAGAAVGIIAHYRRTGRLPLGRLPWRKLKAGAHDITARYFRKPRPTTLPGVTVDYDTSELEGIFRGAGFESGDLYSFEYDGEVLNMRKPTGMYKNVPSELHVRTFQLEDHGSLLLAHHEASRFEAWKEHISGQYMSWDRGRERLKDILDATGVSYDEVESEQAANLNVV